MYMCTCVPCVLLYLLRVPMVVDDDVLRLCKVENSLLAPPGKEFHPNHLLHCQKGHVTTKVGIYKLINLSHILDQGIIK